MPKTITQYNVFIGSPGGLDDERRKFRTVLEKCSRLHGNSRDVRFHPMGSEDTIGGIGRPQELINEDLKRCDYAVFVLHDRWGSSTGGDHTSGTAKEWALAQDLYKANKIRNIALFFKTIDPTKLAESNDQLKHVLIFKKEIDLSKRYFFKQYTTLDEFADMLDGHLAAWLQEHDKMITDTSTTKSTFIMHLTNKSNISKPNFEYWITESYNNIFDETKDYTAALFCATKAVGIAGTDIEWAEAQDLRGIAQFHLGKIADSISILTEIADRFSTSRDADRRSWHARALCGKAFALGALGRGDDAIAVYNDVLARFGTATELPLREQVAAALVSKGVRLITLGRSDDAIAAFDDFLAQFGTATELPLREQVAAALVSKGLAFGERGRNDDAIAACDDVLARFGTATEPRLCELVAGALLSKGLALAELGRDGDAIAVYDDVLARFGTATELALREQVARALVKKGFALGELGLGENEIAVYDDVLARFGTANELPLREAVARSLVDKGFRLGTLGRGDDAIAVYNDVLSRFGTTTELTLREQVAGALLSKGVRLIALGRSNDAIAVCDDILARFGTATERPLRAIVESAGILRNLS